MHEFYEQALGGRWPALRFESDSFSKMVGTSQTTIPRQQLRPGGRDVMLGIIRYGLPPGSFESLRERKGATAASRPVGVRLDVTGLDALLERCVRHGVELRVPPAAGAYRAFGADAARSYRRAARRLALAGGGGAAFPKAADDRGGDAERARIPVRRR